VSAPLGVGLRSCASDTRWAGRTLRGTEADHAWRTGAGKTFGAHRHPVFPSGRIAGQRAQHGRTAGRRSRHPVAGEEQPETGAVGIARNVLAGARPRLPDLAFTAAVRSLETDAGGRRMGAHWLDQLGCKKPEAQLRDESRVLQSGIREQDEGMV